MARSTGLLDALDEAVRSADDLSSVIGRRPIGRDDGVRAFDDAGGLCRIAEAVLDCGDVLELLHLLWSAGCRYDGMTAIDQFLENDAACLTCASVENDFQLDCSLYDTGVVSMRNKPIRSPVWRKSFQYSGQTRRQNKKSAARTGSRREVMIDAIDVAIDHALENGPRAKSKFLSQLLSLRDV
jgi:hypothetical protein